MPQSAPADVATSPQGIGQLLVDDPQSGATFRLNVARYHVHVVLQPPVALVQIDQSFYNPFARQQEGTFLFDLPTRASVSRFAMYVSRTELIEGEVVERKRASNIYESIVRARRDPAILEQIGDNLFKMRVFPIFARDTKRILLDYTVPLVADDGRYRFKLLLMSDLEPIWDFRLSGVIHSAKALDTVAAAGWPDVSFERREDGAISFQFERQNHRPERTLAIEFDRQTDREIEVRSYTPPPEAGTRAGAGRETYVTAMLSPGSVPGTDRAAPAGPVDVVLLADTSFAIRDRDAVRRTVRSIVEHLRGDDRFRLNAVDVEVRPMGPSWSSRGTPAADAALDEFAAQLFLGTLNIENAVAKAAAQFGPAEPGRRRLVVYVGDGIATFGQRSPHFATEITGPLRQADAQFFAAQIGSSATGRTLLESLARETGGRVFDAVPGRGERDECLAWQRDGFPSPVKLIAVELDGAEPGNVYFDPSWVPGRTFDVFAKRPTPDANAEAERSQFTATIRVTTELAGVRTEKHWDLTLRRDSDDVFVGRHWAERRLAVLQAKDQSGETEVEPEIVRLSKEWGLLSRHTAFLVLESEADYRRYSIERNVRRRYWRPADAVLQVPLSADLVRAPAKPLRPITVDEFDRAVAAARAALDAGDPAGAIWRLNQVKAAPQAGAQEFATIERQARERLDQQRVLDSLGPLRHLFARDGDPGNLEPNVAPLLLPGLSSEFIKQHPQANQLVREIRPDDDAPTLDEFVRWLADATRVNVVVHEPALGEEGVHRDTRVHLAGVRRMSLRNVLHTALAPHRLTVVAAPSRFLVTSVRDAADRQRTQVYPVTDILEAGREPEIARLGHAFADQDRRAEARIVHKLAAPIDIDFKNAPLARVVDFFADTLGDNVLVDRRALDDEGRDPDRTRVTANWHDATAREVLEWILEPIQLDFVISREALRITSRLQASNELETRLHPARGLLYELPMDEWPTLDVWPDPPGRGGLGGVSGIGGAMGGGGGFGGGFVTTRPSTSMSDTESGTDVVAGSTAPQPTSVIESDDPPPPARPPFDLGSWMTNDEEFTDLIRQTVTETSWSWVGGPGDIRFWRPTHDFVVRQTRREHQKVAEMLDSLRRLPPAKFATPGRRSFRPARVPTVGVESADALIELVESLVAPNSWSSVGGPGTIEFDAPRAALVASVSQDVHVELTTLLSDLRRSRYQWLHSPAMGTPSDDGRASMVFSGPFVTPLRSDLQIGRLPAPQRDELRTLEVRRQPIAGSFTWRHTWLRSDSPHANAAAVINPDAVVATPGCDFVVRRGGARTELQFDTATVRIEGDDAAVAYPSLSLVEHGTWGEAARRLLDARLPWLPYRSNAELATLFVVEKLGEDAGTVRIRFRPAGSAGPTTADAAGDRPDGLHIDAAFSRQHGLPVAWDAYVGGQLTHRLRFSQLDDETNPRSWRTVTAEDARERPIERWELVEANARPATIPTLSAGWTGYVQLGGQPDATEPRPQLRSALAAIHAGDWRQAARELDTILTDHPDQPLSLFLLAFCHGNEAGTVPRERAIAALTQVVRSDAEQLMRAISPGHFPYLEPIERLEILRQQPAKRRSASDWLALAQASESAGRLDEAAEHLDAARHAPIQDSNTIDLEARRIDLLLRLGRTEAAVAAAQSLANLPGVATDELVRLAELLARYEQKRAADEFFARAMSRPDLSPADRFEIVARRATLHVGRERWKLLLHAIRELPERSSGWNRGLDAVLAEMIDPAHAEIARQLAADLPHGPLWAALRLREAYLVRDLKHSAEICWELHEAGELPDSDIDWACLQFLRVSRADRAVALLESQLLANQPITRSRLDLLASAYSAVRRPHDAERARMSRPFAH